MPLRKDLKSVLLIGSGPIVIGQACEFDYSGTQALKALREEGLRLILVNSNPATIMTDPELADRTYIEPMTVAVAHEDHRDASAPTRCCRRSAGRPRSTSRSNWPKRACSSDSTCELIGAKLDAIKKAEDRDLFKSAMLKIGLEVPRLRDRAFDGRRRARFARELGLPLIIRPSRTLGGTGGSIAREPERLSRQGRCGLEHVAEPRSPDRAIGRGLEGIRARGDARHAPTTSSSSARSKTSIRWACIPAIRSRSRPRRR